MADRLGPASIFYDFDGTLVDSFPGIEAATRAAVRQLFPQWELPPLRPLIGPALRGMLEGALPLATSAELDHVASTFRQLYDGGMCLECALYPEVAATLEKLHGYSGAPRPFIVTNKRLVPTLQLLDHFGLGGFFEGVIASDSKPGFASKVEAVAWVLRKYNLTASETLFVGDSRDDYEAASLNAIPFIPVAYGYGSAPEHSSAVPLIAFAEFPGAVAALYAPQP